MSAPVVSPLPAVVSRPLAPAVPLRLVLASNNAKKLSELGALLAGLPIELLAQGTLGIAEADEPHHSFIENALHKARHASAAAGCAALADDSGLCVDALAGAPGVVSAHFAGLVAASPGQSREALRRLQDAANNAHLLQRLAALHVPSDASSASGASQPGEPSSASTNRTARFVCTLVAVRHASDPEPLVAVGRWDGQILNQAAGEQGFGYDPLMWIPDLGQTVAQLDASTKNSHSHRARAMQQMRQLLLQTWLTPPVHR
jgi:XTP/dITP diphosphohydrolase